MQWRVMPRGYLAGVAALGQDAESFCNRGCGHTESPEKGSEGRRRASLASTSCLTNSCMLASLLKGGPCGHGYTSPLGVLHSSTAPTLDYALCRRRAASPKARAPSSRAALTAWHPAGTLLPAPAVCEPGVASGGAERSCLLCREASRLKLLRAPVCEGVTAQAAACIGSTRLQKQGCETCAAAAPHVTRARSDSAPLHERGMHAPTHAHRGRQHQQLSDSPCWQARAACAEARASAAP